MNHSLSGLYEAGIAAALLAYFVAGRAAFFLSLALAGDLLLYIRPGVRATMETLHIPSLRRRATAYLIDETPWFVCGILPITALELWSPGRRFATEHPWLGGLYCLWFLLSVVGFLTQMTWVEWRRGMTVGKRIMRLRVAMADGSPCSRRACIVRNISRFLLDLQIGGLPAFVCM